MSFGRCLAVAAIAFVISVGASVRTTAQQAGAINGTVSDQTGAPVAGATVELVTGLAITRSTVTDNQGRYRFDGLDPREHAVRVTETGFMPGERRVTVAASGSAIADFQLVLATMVEAVHVVAASGYARPATELPVSATVVTREQALASPERSVDGLLRNVASVQLQGYDVDSIPLEPSLSMRGVGIGDSADRGLALVDGLPINGGFFGHVNWNRAPKRLIDRVEVVRGASSSLFGSYAMGGVVDIITRVPASRETAIDLQYGEHNRVQGNLFHGGVAGTKTAYSFNANLADSDGFYTVRDDERRPIDTKLSSRLGNVQGRLDHAPTDRLRVFVKAAYDDLRRRGPYQNAGIDSDVVDVAGGLGANLKSAGTLDVRAMSSREHFDVRNVRVVNDTTTFVANPHVTEADTVVLSALWSQARTGPLAQLSAGVDLRRVDGSDAQDVYNTPGQLNAHIVGAGLQTSVGVFGQVSVRPSSNTELLAGLRLDRFNNADGQIVTDGVAQSFDDRTLTIPSFRVAGRVQATSAVGVRGAIFKGFTAPTLATLYRSFESPTFRGLANPDLKEERLLGGDGGVEVRHGRMSTQINGFYNRVDDFLGSVEVEDASDKFTVQIANVVAIRSRGVEAIADFRLARKLTLTGNYTFTGAVVVEGDLKGNAVEGVPRHAFGLSGMYVASSWAATVKARYVAATFQDIDNEAPQDARFLVDVLASKRIHRHLELFVAGENLFDYEYIADGFSQSLGAPRQISGGLRLTF